MTTVRSLLRRAVRPLPASAQIALREWRERVGGVDDSAPRVRALREAEQPVLDEIAAREAAKPGRLRVLMGLLQQSPPWLDTAYGLATALRLRGHDVRGVLCDGVFPICEMNLGSQDRPRCDVCEGWLSRYEDAYGFAFARATACADPADVTWAETAVADAERSSAPLLADGLDLRRLARRELQRYRRGFAFDPTADPAYRQWLMSAALGHRMAGRLLDRERPDMLVVSSGRTLLSAVFVAAARARGVRVVTWDTEPSFPDGLVFSHDEPAVQIPLDAAWDAVKREPLTPAERDRLLEFLGRWSRSDGTPFPYNPAPLDDQLAIGTALGLRPGARLVAAFANSAWDMAVVDRDVGFTHMFDWLFTLVEYAAAHPEVDVVIRAHPAEVKVPAGLQSRTPVVAELRRRFAEMPGNVALVDGHSAISSYALAGMADVATVYSSRFGLELAIGGRRPWLAGDVSYRGKGFTRDLAGKADFVQALEAGARSDALTPTEVELAERFAWLWFFRYIIRTPLLRPADEHVALQSFRPLAPGGDAQLDRICDAIADGAPFIAR